MSATAASAREQILIVGSSTVFPYTQAVAEEFANQGGTSPVVESTGTRRWHADSSAAVSAPSSRHHRRFAPDEPSEYELCVENGVTDITEALIGYDGLSIASFPRENDDLTDLTLEQIYLALGEMVPVGPRVELDPYTNWSRNRLQPARPTDHRFRPPADLGHP